MLTFYLRIICFCFLQLASLLIHSTLAGQPVKGMAYQNLGMEGGGIRGIAYGGALAELEKQGILASIKRVGGTSAGAIQACLLAVGYSPEEITNITYQTPIQQFSDGRLFFAGGFHRMKIRYGWYRGEKFRNWMGKLISQKTGNADITFQELHQLAGRQGFRDLYVTATDLSNQRMVVLSHETFPTMKVKDAIRISMSIPLFFQAVGVTTEGQLIEKGKFPANTRIMADGGILANYPITLFDQPKYVSTADTSGLYRERTVRFTNPETLGIRLDRAEQISYDRQHLGLAPYEIKNVKDYLGALYNITIESLNRNTLNHDDFKRTISINTLNFGPKIKQLSKNQKNQLIESGQRGVQEFLSGRE
jgi:NTE family protein